MIIKCLRKNPLLLFCLGFSLPNISKPADELIPRVVLKAAHIRVLLQSTVIGSRLGIQGEGKIYNA